MNTQHTSTIDQILFRLLDNADVPHRGKMERNKSIFRSFHGLDGGPGTTLEEQGEANGGLTRECVRQIVNNIQAQFFLSQEEKAQAQTLVEIVEGRIPCELAELSNELKHKGLISPDLSSPEGVINLCMSIMKLKPKARYQDVNGVVYAVPYGQPGLVKKIQSEAIKVVGGFGACSIESVVSRIDHLGPGSEAFVRSVLNASMPVTWLDDSEDWFTTATDYKNCFARRIESVFSVYEEVHVEALYRVMARSLRQIKVSAKASPEYEAFGRGALKAINEKRAAEGKEPLLRKPSVKESEMRMAFDINVFKALLRTISGVALVGDIKDTVRGSGFGFDASGPSVVERKVIKALSKAGEAGMRESEIKAAAGLGDKEWYGFIAASNFSPLLSRAGRGRYKLVGKLSD